MASNPGSSGGPIWSSLVIILLTTGSAFLPGFEKWGQTVLLCAGALLVFLGLVGLVRGNALGGLAALAFGVFFLPFFCYAVPAFVRGETPEPDLKMKNPLLEKITSFLPKSGEAEVEGSDGSSAPVPKAIPIPER